MADEIEIPSPSVFLRRSTSPPPRPSAAEPPSRPKPVRQTSAGKITKKAPTRKSSPESNTAVKPKQFKSRNGCSTCKQKRLKCDETKPACLQCTKKGKKCGGYKKDFKWRPFEEANVKVIIDRQKGEEPPGRQNYPDSPPAELPQAALPLPGQARGHRRRKSAVIAQDVSTSMHSFEQLSLQVRSISSNETSPQDQHSTSPGPASGPQSLRKDGREQAAIVSGLNSAEAFARTLPSASSGPERLPSPHVLLDENIASPSLTEIMDLHASTFSDDETAAILASMSNPGLADVGDSDFVGEDHLTAALDQPPTITEVDDDLWTASSLDSPALSISLSSSRKPESVMRLLECPSHPLYKQPFVSMAHPDHLLGRFNTSTCGILSMMDGPDENPWRSLIWPLAQQSPALFHAILAMTAFHVSKDIPQFRTVGTHHKQQSIHNIRVGLRDTSIGLHTSIATALALGFAEAWDQHTATGNEHIKGAQALIRRALDFHQMHPLQGAGLRRLKFLCNAWVYMDVIARLTAVDSNDSMDFDNTLLFPPDSPQIPMHSDASTFGLNFGMPLDARLDPLMGCASTLFPLIGRVANLVKKVFRSRANSPAMISQANDLKQALEDWRPPSYIDTPQDPSTDPQHTVQTAEAYRWATLLHLHQAVPEIPSPTSEQLAQRVLQFLATVPISSRTIIVQIYPLMVAGCVVESTEDRTWVLERWDAMDNRMRIGIIDKSVEVTKEVWRRTDEFDTPPDQGYFPSSMGSSAPDRNVLRSPPSRRTGSFDWSGTVFSYVQDNRDAENADRYRRFSRDGTSPPAYRIMGGPLPTAFTVRGSCHWVGVMWDWGWQILLG